MQEFEFRAMGSHILALIDAETTEAEYGIRAVAAWFETWEQHLSRFRADSELSLVNAASGQPTRVSPVLWEVLLVALAAAKQSNGLVRPTMLAALEQAGYDRSFELIGSDNHLHPRATESTDWHAITLDPQTHTVALPAGMRLDFGGIAKGWAAQCAAQQLSALGPTLIDAGGDIVVSGPMADGQAWPIGIADPFDQEHSFGTLLLAHGAVATSGRDYRRWQRDGAWLHHIIDPRSGVPAQTDVLSATVVASSGPVAEMAAKAAMILGSDAGLRWIEQHNDLAALLVCEDGSTVASQRLASVLEPVFANIRSQV